MKKISDFWKGMLVMGLVMLILGFLFGGYVHNANRDTKPATTTINNPALAVTPAAGPSPTAKQTPTMSADQADRFKKAGVTWEGSHGVEVK